MNSPYLPFEAENQGTVLRIGFILTKDSPEKKGLIATIFLFHIIQN